MPKKTDKPELPHAAKYGKIEVRYDGKCTLAEATVEGKTKTFEDAKGNVLSQAITWGREQLNQSLPTPDEAENGITS